jgi:hypothetical protein
VPLLYLGQLPRWVPGTVLAAAFVAGLAMGGWAGAVALCAVAAALGWLAYLSWPRLPRSGRLGRMITIGALLGLAVLLATR